VRPISRRVLVRQLAMAIARDGRAECRGLPEWWSSQEAAHAAALTRRQAAAAAGPAMKLCARCPVPFGRGLRIAGCGAQLDEYTGLAASGAYVNGERVAVDRLRNSPRGSDQVAG